MSLMTGVLAQAGSFLHTVFSIPVAYAAEEGAEHAAGIHVG